MAGPVNECWELQIFEKLLAIFFTFTVFTPEISNESLFHSLLTTTLIYKYMLHRDANNVDIKLIPFENCLIHKATHLDSCIRT